MKPIILLLLLPLYTFAQKKIPVGKPINTDKYTEYAPTFSADGQRMVFQSDHNRYRAWYLYESTYQKTNKRNGHKNGKWSKPRPIESINNFGEKPSKANGFQTDFIAAPSLSADGNTLFFTATFHSGLGGRDLYYVTRQKDGNWSRPRNVGPPINTAGHEDFASISPDGQQLYFARPLKTSRAGEGCYELYVAKKRKGRWQSPTRLPSPINTGCEKCVRVQADGVTLIFSSERKDGQGGFDLYKAVLSVNGRYWESVKAIKEANSSQFDKFATVVEVHNTVYFNSQGPKSPDIFKLSALPDYLRLQKFAPVQGKVLAKKMDEKLGQQELLEANLKLYWLNPYSGNKEVIEQTSTSSQTGSFALRLRAKHQYILEASAAGFESKQVTFDLRAYRGEDYSSIMIVLTPKAGTKPMLAINDPIKNNKKTVQGMTSKEAKQRKKGQQIKATSSQPNTYTPSEKISIGKNRQVKTVVAPENTKQTKKSSLTQTGISEVLNQVRTIPDALAWRFPRIQFAYKSFDLTNEASVALKNAVVLLQRFKSLKLYINGHTDDLGAPEVNRQLSLKRALAVQKSLVQQGIDPKRLLMKGYGQTKPLKKGSKAANRRVEIHLIK
ncbi:MAG TPA: hypothetical protein DCS93_18105 [Microscillaceae bacterium]|nr:hypothetical protein [Microscillaceae bacterium]